MIELSVFLESFTGLMATFDKTFPDKAIRSFYELLSSQLTTEEFETACNKAYGCKFFPTPDELIGLALGTVEERAEREWEDIDTPFSVVGLKALNAIGGWILSYPIRSPYLHLLKKQGNGVFCQSALSETR